MWPNQKLIPHDKYNIRGTAHARTNRKDNIFMQRRLVQSLTYVLEWGPGTCTLTNLTTHGAGHIPRQYTLEK